MDEGLKKRLVGATVLVSLVVIFVPMLLDQEPVVDQGIERNGIPPRPPRSFPSRVLPDEDEQIAVPPASITEAQVPATAPSAAEAETTPPQPAEPQPAVEPESEQPPPATRPPLSGWVIQAGSFSNRSNADKLTQQLRNKGFSAFVEQAEVQGKTVARVLVGPEADRRLAEQLMARLNRELKASKLVGKLKVYSGPGHPRSE